MGAKVNFAKVGLAVGKGVGIDVDGADDGTSDGAADGAPDGAVDGTADGASDGAVDGAADGPFFVGDLVGLRVGIGGKVNSGKGGWVKLGKRGGVMGPGLRPLHNCRLFSLLAPRRLFFPCESLKSDSASAETPARKKMVAKLINFIVDA